MTYYLKSEEFEKQFEDVNLLTLFNVSSTLFEEMLKDFNVSYSFVKDKHVELLIKVEKEKSILNFSFSLLKTEENTIIVNCSFLSFIERLKREYEERLYEIDSIMLSFKEKISITKEDVIQYLNCITFNKLNDYLKEYIELCSFYKTETKLFMFEELYNLK